MNIFTEMKRQKLRSKMVMQVHDELNFDIVQEELEQMKILVKKEMEQAVNIGLPLTVEMNAGKNWLEAH